MMRLKSQALLIRTLLLRTLVVAALMPFVLKAASAQAFNSFTGVTLDSGATFKVNGTVVTPANLATIFGAGADDVDFGFSTAHAPIEITLPDHTTLSISAIDMVGLVSGNSITATTPGSTISNYLGNSGGSAWTGGHIGAGPDYKAHDFGSADFLRGGGEYSANTDPATGLFDFGNVSISPTGSQIYFGFDGRIGGRDGQTEKFYIAGIDPPAPSVPEASTSLMFGIGMAMVVMLAVARRRQVVRQV